MAKKKISPAERAAQFKQAGVVQEQSIVDTLEINYMPYAMSVIVSRAIPEIDGFKPSHRKLLYTMYRNGLIDGARTKSANVVGNTMHLNPHGDAAIYETMVRLARGNETLLHPYVDSKGNFGKAYSRDMEYAASRYTEVRLEKICKELFRDIDKDTVDFVPNYDNSTTEPTLLPVTFPTILVNMNLGIAVGMASNICSFNLQEICDATVALMQDENHDLLSTITAPDFCGGGQVLYNAADLQQVIDTGRGSFKIRAKYHYDESTGSILVTQIPPTTTAEAIVDKVVELVKAGKIKDITNIKDLTDLGGLRIAIDIKRGVDPNKLMLKLFKMTPLEDSFSCNFNILVGGNPMVLGIRDILLEWIAFRRECVQRRVYFELSKCKEKLHRLKALEKILLDIDKAIKIVRETDEESEVVPNLMIGFGIDQEQAEYVAEIKLRHLNREYILKRTAEIEELIKAIADMEDILKSKARVQAIITEELQAVVEHYAQDRRTEVVYSFDTDDGEEEEESVPDYPVHVFVTKEGYLKKITPASLRMYAEQKLKEGDEIVGTFDTANNMDVLVFSDKQQCYKVKLADFPDTKASAFGEFLPAKVGMDSGEGVSFVALTKDYKGYVFFVFENGKAAKVELSAYATKTNRRKLIGAYSDKSPLAQAVQFEQDQELLITSSAGKVLLVHTGAVAPKSTKNTQGVNCMTLKKGQKVVSVKPYRDGDLASPHRYRVKTLPGAGATLSAKDVGSQQSLDF